MFKKMLKMIRDKQGAALISVVLLFIVLSIVGISLTGVAMYSHRKSISNWEYEQAHYIARSSAISIRDYAKSIINEITSIDNEIADVEYQIMIEQSKAEPNLDPLIDLRDELISKSNAEKAKIESILSTGTNEIKATGKILSATDDDFEATIIELEAGEDAYSKRKYKVSSKGKFQGVEAVATVYINYKPIDEYLPYLGPTPEPGGSYGGLMDSFVFYSEVKTIMASYIEGDVNILRNTSPIAATNNVVIGDMFVGSFTDGGVFAQTIQGDLIAPHSITLHGCDISGAVIVDGDFKTGVSTKINEYISASGNVALENNAVVPIVYTKGNLTMGNNSGGASITGFDTGDGTLTAAKSDGLIEITNSTATGNVISNEGIHVLRGVVIGNLVTAGAVVLEQPDTKIYGNVIGNKSVLVDMSTVEGNIYSQGDIILEMPTITGNVVSKGNILLPSGHWGGTFNGDLISYGDIRIEHGGCAVNGNIIAMGDIYIDGNVQSVTGEIISIGGTITDNRWGDKSANYKEPPLVSDITVPVLKAERIDVELPRIEDTSLTLKKFYKFTIPGYVKAKDADAYKEDNRSIVINSSGKINTDWFDPRYGNDDCLLDKDTGWSAYPNQTLIIDASDDDIDLYLDGSLKFQSSYVNKILVRGSNIVRIFMEKGSEFIMDNVHITSEINEHYVYSNWGSITTDEHESNDGLTPPNLYIMASSAELQSDIPKISFGSTSGSNCFEGYIISPSSSITVKNTRVLGAIVAESLESLHSSNMRFYPARKLDQALNGLDYTFKEIQVDKNGITERVIPNP